MRSRSQGRHPLSNDYLSQWGMYSSGVYSNASYANPVANKERSKSGTLYYSSGGSNDGRSPPPELALLSGIPPPGPMIRKPTALPRPKSKFSYGLAIFELCQWKQFFTSPSFGTNDI